MNKGEAWLAADTGKFELREYLEGDIEALALAFAGPGQNKPAEQFQRYWDENAAGLRQTFIALVDGEIVAYSNLIFKSHYAHFAEEGIPEINDMNTLAPFRKQGIATALVGACEQCALSLGLKVIGIGVGLTPDYSMAARLYPALGFVSDGRGNHEDGMDGVTYFLKSLE
jgi:GNAT superfamily N-acetyltransferase